MDATGSEKHSGEQKAQTGYDREYAFALAVALDWPVEKLTGTLKSMVRDYRHSEEMWGVIDAFTDLIRKNAPPLWIG